MAEQETVGQKAQAPAAPQRKPVLFPYSNTPVPEPFASVIQFVGDRWDGLRQYLVTNLPKTIINSSSNVIGSLQIVAEIMMFKSSGLNLLDKEHKGNPLYYIIDAPKNIFRGAFAKVKLKPGNPADLLKPSTYINAARDFVDLERATELHSAGGKLLVNNMSALSSVTGLSAMTWATLMPDRKESAEETEKMATLARENPVGYVGHRLLQTINPISWVTDKRQVVGLGMTGAGFFSFLSGFRQVAGKVAGDQHYRRNYWQAAGGAITTLAGLQLWFGINNQQGWSNFGTTQLARLFTLYPSISNRFKPDASGKPEQGAGWYLGAQTAMVIKNSTASLIGGGHRGAHGEVIDHSAMREDAKRKANEEYKSEHPPKPQVSGVQRDAMVSEAPEAVLQT